MGKVLAFEKLKIGEVLVIAVKGQRYKCEVLQGEGKVYKLRILDGEHKGKYFHFEMTSLEDRRFE